MTKGNQKGTRWNASDDAKLLQLWRTPHNGIDPEKLDKDSIQAVLERHWPLAKYSNFAPLYKQKAREYNVSRTLDGHRQRSADLRAAQQGQVRLEDISDDGSGSEDAFSGGDSEEEDLELEGFLEESDQESEASDMSTPLASRRSASGSGKKPTPRKTSAKKPKPATELDVKGLSASMKNLSVSKPWSMDLQMPYIVYVYQEGDEDYCSVDFFGPVLPKDYFYPDVVDGGNTLQVSVKIPDFFTKPNRKVKVKKSLQGFNENTSEAQAFKTVCHEIDSHFDFKDEKVGEPTSVVLPFTCEERLVHWEVQGYKNNLADLTDKLGGQQFHWCLSVTVRKLVNKIRVGGGFVIVESDDEEEMKDDDL